MAPLAVAWRRFVSGECHAGVSFAFYAASVGALLFGLYECNRSDQAFPASAFDSCVFVVVWTIPFTCLLIAGWGAFRSLARAKRAGSRLTANLVEAGQTALVASGLPLILFCLVLQLPVSAVALSQGARMLHGPLWHVTVDRSVLRISGEFTEGISEAVEQRLSANPAIRIVVFNSPGGNIEEALRVGRAIKDRGLATGVSNQCASACTFSFAAGRERILLAPGKLGFHGCRRMVWFSDCRNGTYVAYMVANGVQRDFITRALSVSPERLWIPTPAELLAAHVITGTTIQARR
jgi:hypothetical protein